MKELINFFSKHSFLILFLFLEGISMIFIFQNNSFQKSYFINSARNVTGYLYKTLQGYKEYFYLHEINKTLSEENVRLRNEVYSKHSRNEDSEIPVADTIEDRRYTYKLVRVINNSVTRQYNYITLDAGSHQGLQQDMAVISEQGVVGIITAVSTNYALVLPVLNRNFRLSAKILRNNYFGILEWEGLSSKQVALKEIPVHADVFKGDDVVTSGHSAIFPEGIFVGKIVDLRKEGGNFYDITVELATDFGNLYYVNVVKNLQRDEQITLENRPEL